MKNNNLELCRLRVEFILYSKIVDSIHYLLLNDSDRLKSKLKHDLSDLVSIEFVLKDCLVECKKQISFLENFLDDCGVDVYDKN